MNVVNLATGATQVVAQGFSRLQDVDLDTSTGVLYFADWGPVGPPGGEGSINRVNPDGTGLATVLNTGDGVHQLAIDEALQRIYFTRAVSYDNREISHVTTAGAGYTVLFTGGWFPSGLAVDPVNSLLYWGDIGVLNFPPNGSVNRMGTVGSAPTQFTPHVDGRGRGFALDPATQTIFLTSHDPRSPGTGGGLFSFDIANNIETLLISDPGTGYWDIEIDPVDQRIWWTDYGRGEIRSALFDGSDVQVEVSNLSNPYGLALEFAADLSIAKTDSPDPVIAGTNLTYTVTVSNAGPSDAQDVVVTDTLPAGPTLVATSGCAEDPTGVPTCSLGTIPAGGSASYTIEVAVASNVGDGDTLINNVSLVSSTTDPDLANNSTTEATGVIREADLSIVKSDDPDPVVSGDTLTYTVTVTNNGPSDADGVAVTDTLPAEVTLVSTAGCAEDPAGVPPCTLGTIAAGASANYTITVSVNNSIQGNITNTATVASNEIDPDLANNATAEDTFALSPADVVGTKTVVGNFAEFGDITYTVVIENLSPHAQFDEPGSDEFVDVLPPEVVLVAATADSGAVTVDIPSNTVRWNGSIPGFGQVVVTIEAVINAGTQGQTVGNEGTIFYDSDGDGVNDGTRLVEADFVVATVIEVPTASALGLALLALLLAGLGAIALRRRHAS